MPRLVFRHTAFLLSLALALPNSALALRPKEPREDPNRRSGMEEALRPAAGAEEVAEIRLGEEGAARFLALREQMKNSFWYLDPLNAAGISQVMGDRHWWDVKWLETDSVRVITTIGRSSSGWVFGDVSFLRSAEVDSEILSLYFGEVKDYRGRNNPWVNLRVSDLQEIAQAAGGVGSSIVRTEGRFRAMTVGGYLHVQIKVRSLQELAEQFPVLLATVAFLLKNKPATGAEETRGVVPGQEGQKLPVRMFKTTEGIGRTQAEEVMELWTKAVTNVNPLVIGLPTGSTPLPMLRELVAWLSAMSESKRDQYLRQLYIVAMDDIVDPQTNRNVEPEHPKSARRFFDENFIKQMPPVHVFWEAHLFVPTVGELTEQIRRIQDLGGVSWQMMATDPNEGHVAEVAAGETFRDPAVQARKNQPRKFSDLFLKHNEWATGYLGITLTLDDFVDLMAPAGKVSFAAFGSAKSAVVQRLITAGQYDPQLPISFLWLDEMVHRTELLLDEEIARPIPDIIRADSAAGAEESISKLGEFRHLAVQIRRRVQDDGEAFSIAFRRILKEYPGSVEQKLLGEPKISEEDLLYVVVGDKWLSQMNDPELSKRHLASQFADENLRILPMVISTIYRMTVDSRKMPETADAVILNMDFKDIRTALPLEEQRALISRVLEVTRSSTAGGAEERVEVSEGAFRDGASDSGQRQEEAHPSRMPTMPSKESTTSQVPPFSGANQMADAIQPRITTPKPALSSGDNFPKKFPANPPANIIFERSASVLDSTGRLPSVNTGLPLISSVLQPPDADKVNQPNGLIIDINISIINNNPAAGAEEAGIRPMTPEELSSKLKVLIQQTAPLPEEIPKIEGFVAEFKGRPAWSLLVRKEETEIHIIQMDLHTTEFRSLEIVASSVKALQELYPQRELHMFVSGQAIETNNSLRGLGFNVGKVHRVPQGDKQIVYYEMVLPPLSAGAEETHGVVHGQEGRKLPVTVFKTPDWIGRAQAREVMELWAKAVAEWKPFIIGLPTGSTPMPLLNELVNRLNDMEIEDRSHYLRRLYIVAMDDIVDSKTGTNVTPEHLKSARRFFQENFYGKIPGSEIWESEGLIIPTVGKLTEQIEEVKRRGGVAWQMMATDPNEGHVAEVAAGERFRDPAVQARKDQPREFSTLFLQHNAWAKGYQGITFTLDDFVDLMAPQGKVSFVVFGAAKSGIVQKFIADGEHNPERPISFLWLPEMAHRVELLLDAEAARFILPWIQTAPNAGAEELDPAEVRLFFLDDDPAITQMVRRFIPPMLAGSGIQADQQFAVFEKFEDVEKFVHDNAGKKFVGLTDLNTTPGQASGEGFRVVELLLKADPSAHVIMLATPLNDAQQDEIHRLQAAHPDQFEFIQKPFTLAKLQGPLQKHLLDRLRKPDSTPPPTPAGAEESISKLAEFRHLAVEIRRRVQDDGEDFSGALRRILKEYPGSVEQKLLGEPKISEEDLLYVIVGDKGLSQMNDPELSKRHLTSQFADENLRILPMVIRTIYRMAMDSGKMPETPDAVIFNMDFGNIQAALPLEEQRALISRILEVTRSSTPAGAEERIETRERVARGGDGFGTDQWPTAEGQSRTTTDRSKDSTTSQASPFSGANTQANAKKLNTTITKPLFSNPEGSLPNKSPAIAPAKGILPASANDLHSTARRPSVNSSFFDKSSLPPFSGAVKSASALEERMRPVPSMNIKENISGINSIPSAAGVEEKYRVLKNVPAPIDSAHSRRRGYRSLIYAGIPSEVFVIVQLEGSGWSGDDRSLRQPEYALVRLVGRDKIAVIHKRGEVPDELILRPEDWPPETARGYLSPARVEISRVPSGNLRIAWSNVPGYVPAGKVQVFHTAPAAPAGGAEELDSAVRDFLLSMEKEPGPHGQLDLLAQNLPKFDPAQRLEFLRALPFLKDRRKVSVWVDIIFSGNSFPQLYTLLFEAIWEKGDFHDLAALSVLLRGLPWEKANAAAFKMYGAIEQKQESDPRSEEIGKPLVPIVTQALAHSMIRVYLEQTQSSDPEDAARHKLPLPAIEVYARLHKAHEQLVALFSRIGDPGQAGVFVGGAEMIERGFAGLYEAVIIALRGASVSQRSLFVENIPVVYQATQEGLDRLNAPWRRDPSARLMEFDSRIELEQIYGDYLKLVSQAEAVSHHSAAQRLRKDRADFIAEHRQKLGLAPAAGAEEVELVAKLRQQMELFDEALQKAPQRVIQRARPGVVELRSILDSSSPGQFSDFLQKAHDAADSVDRAIRRFKFESETDKQGILAPLSSMVIQITLFRSSDRARPRQPTTTGPAAGAEEIKRLSKVLRNKRADPGDLMQAAGELARAGLYLGVDAADPALAVLKEVLLDSRTLKENRLAAAWGLGLQGTAGNLDVLLEALNRPENDLITVGQMASAVSWLYYTDISQVRKAYQALEETAVRMGSLGSTDAKRAYRMVLKAVQGLGIQLGRLGYELLFYDKPVDPAVWRDDLEFLFEKPEDRNILNASAWDKRFWVVDRLEKSNDPFLIPMLLHFLEGVLPVANQDPAGHGLIGPEWTEALQTPLISAVKQLARLMKGDAALFGGSLPFHIMHGQSIYFSHKHLYPASRFRNPMLKVSVEQAWGPIWEEYPPEAPAAGAEEISRERVAEAVEEFRAEWDPTKSQDPDLLYYLEGEGTAFAPALALLEVGKQLDLYSFVGVVETRRDYNRLAAVLEANPTAQTMLQTRILVVEEQPGPDRQQRYDIALKKLSAVMSGMNIRKVITLQPDLLAQLNRILAGFGYHLPEEPSVQEAAGTLIEAA